MKLLRRSTQWSMQKVDETRTSPSGVNEKDEAKDKGWKNKTEEILCLKKELTGRTSEQKVKENLEEEQKKKSHNLKEVGRKSIRKQKITLSLSLSHQVSRGRSMNYRKLWSNLSLTPKEARREKVRKRSRRRESEGVKVKD